MWRCMASGHSYIAGIQPRDKLSSKATMSKPHWTDPATSCPENPGPSSRGLNNDDRSGCAEPFSWKRARKPATGTPNRDVACSQVRLGVCGLQLTAVSSTCRTECVFYQNCFVSTELYGRRAWLGLLLWANQVGCKLQSTLPECTER